MTASRLCAYEQWPAKSGLKPSPHVLALLAHTYNTTIHQLLDLDGWEHLSPADRFLLDKRPDQATPTPAGTTTTPGPDRAQTAVRPRLAGGARADRRLPRRPRARRTRRGLLVAVAARTRPAAPPVAPTVGASIPTRGGDSVLPAPAGQL
jgi:hypothetical protein